MHKILVAPELVQLILEGIRSTSREDYGKLFQAFTIRVQKKYFLIGMTICGWLYVYVTSFNCIFYIVTH